VGALLNGDSESLTITATVTAAGTYTNTAEVETADQTDPDSTPNNNDPSEDDQDEAVIVTPEIDLSLSKSVDDSSPNVGQAVVFTVGLSYVSSSASQGSYTTTTDLWTVGALLNGDSESLTITATVTAAGSYTNTAEVETADQTDPDSTPSNNDPSEDDQDEAVLNAFTPGLDVDKAINIATAAPSQTVTYTITITNTGNITLNPVQVTDTLDIGLAYVPGSASLPPSTISGQQLVWTDVANGAGLDPGNTIQITLGAEVTTTVGIYNNLVATTGDYPGGTTSPEQDTTPVIVEDPSVQVDKMLTAPGVENGLITFTIRITNTGPSILDQVPLFDTFSGPVEYVPSLSTPPADTVDNPNGALSWNDLTTVFGNMVPGQSFEVTTVFQIITNTGTFSMLNTAVVSDAVDVFDNTADDVDDSTQLTDEPTAIGLLYFEANRQGERIILNWGTAVEIDNFGFRLQRSSTGKIADATELAFVPGQGQGTSSGASYTYRDDDVETTQTYTYWLVDVDLNGIETVHGPVTVLAIDSNGSGPIIFLPLIRR
jgi:uncharacterized repeat protein (TIGR01451 family)